MKRWQAWLCECEKMRRKWGESAHWRNPRAQEGGVGDGGGVGICRHTKILASLSHGSWLLKSMKLGMKIASKRQKKVRNISTFRRCNIRHLLLNLFNHFLSWICSWCLCGFSTKAINKNLQPLNLCLLCFVGLRSLKLSSSTCSQKAGVVSNVVLKLASVYLHKPRYLTQRDSSMQKETLKIFKFCTQWIFSEK